MSEQMGFARELPDSDNFAATLLAMAGHDLRQPLQIITSAHEILAMSLQQGEQRQELARAEGATSRLAAMLGQLVDALQLHEGAIDIEGVPVRLGPIFEGLVAEFAERARIKSIGLSIPKTRASVLSHPVLLRSMLRNLVHNAINYTPPGGRVLLICRRYGPALRIEVHDNGVGIRPAHLLRIFEAFERADDTRSDGLGLGLFIVKRAACLLNHRIEVHSAAGRGSCFAIVLDSLAAEAACDSSASTKLAKARAFALACRPPGKTAHKSTSGRDQSSSTDVTAPDFSSGVNIHSEAMAKPRPANTASRTPSAAVTCTRPTKVTDVSAVPFAKVHVGVPIRRS
jgi:K+-sensing histidine kinase KdpD